MSRVGRAGVTDQPLEPEVIDASVSDPVAGAVVSFAGVVRNHDSGREVRELEYSAHPSADAIVRQVCEEILRRHPEVTAVAAVHRVGTLMVGEIALAAAVSAAHRQPAFRACADLVDLVKERLPVWKRQVFADGSDEWVGST